MASYSTDFKEQMVRKMMPPNSQSTAQISRETGVPYATLYTWKKQYQSRGFVVPAKNTNAAKWDAKTKLAAIIQTAAMNEAERSEYCRQNGLYVEQLDEWKEDFEASGPSSPADKRALAAERKKSRKLEKELLRKDRALAETAALLTLSKSTGHLGHQRGRLIPPEQRQMAITLIDEARAAGARCVKACEIIGISERTLRRWRDNLSLTDKRQTPAPRIYEHALTDEEKELILIVSNLPEYKSLPPTQIVPKLADLGVYIASESSFYRVLKAHNQLHRRGREQSHPKHNKPQPLVATGPNQVWSWDITYLPSDVRGQFYRLYLIMDVYSRFIIGWEVHLNETAEHASVLINKACIKHKVRKKQLVLHSDNGSPMKGATMLCTLQKLGIMPSFSRPSVSDDNPYSEAMFRILKYSPAYPTKPFSSLDEARKWVHSFTTWYNNEHCHSGIKFVTPAQRHSGEDKAVLERRGAAYEAAKAANPARWKGRKTRNWEHENEVWLNPPKEKTEEQESLKQVA